MHGDLRPEVGARQGRAQHLATFLQAGKPALAFGPQPDDRLAPSQRDPRMDRSQRLDVQREGDPPGGVCIAALAATVAADLELRHRQSVALTYDAPRAPRVVASGRGVIGQKIIETAQAHGVPIQQNAVLAEALSTIELETEIPERLYVAVAEILAFVLRTAEEGQAR